LQQHALACVPAPPLTERLKRNNGRALDFGANAYTSPHSDASKDSASGWPEAAGVGGEGGTWCVRRPSLD